jgi:hypothetical protein
MHLLSTSLFQIVVVEELGIKEITLDHYLPVSVVVKVFQNPKTNGRADPLWKLILLV